MRRGRRRFDRGGIAGRHYRRERTPDTQDPAQPRLTDEEQVAKLYREIRTLRWQIAEREGYAQALEARAQATRAAHPGHKGAERTAQHLETRARVQRNAAGSFAHVILSHQTTLRRVYGVSPEPPALHEQEGGAE